MKKEFNLLSEFEELNEIFKKLKELELFNWKIDNISSQYFSVGQGQINLRLLRKKSEKEEIKK